MLITVDSDEEVCNSCHNKKVLRNSLPKIVSQKVDLQELRAKLAQGSKEMDNYVDVGKMPVFGYPLVCYSPVGQPARAKGEFWQIMYATTMQNQLGTPNVIGELLDSHDNFKLKHEQLMRDFSRGRYMSREYAEKKGIYTPVKKVTQSRLVGKSLAIPDEGAKQAE